MESEQQDGREEESPKYIRVEAPEPYAYTDKRENCPCGIVHYTFTAEQWKAIPPKLIRYNPYGDGSVSNLDYIQGPYYTYEDGEYPIVEVDEDG